MLCTGISLQLSQWDAERQTVVSHPRKAQLNAMLAERKVDADCLLYDLGSAGELAGLTIAQVKNRIAQALSPEPEPQPKRLTFLSRFDAFVALKSTGTQRVYNASRRRMETYLGADALARLTFEEMDVSWLRAFDKWLSKTSPAKNARNIHFRNIRAVFNDAITDELITCYPFRKFRITPEPTRKRSLTREQFVALMRLPLKPWQERYRDCFKLIFLLQGINIVDLCRLSSVVNGRAEYRRAKTKRLYSIILLPETLRLMEKYKGDGQLLNYLDTCKNYRSFYNRLTYALRCMGEQIGIKGLSTYWARHTWATFASSLDIPKETIAAALGHGGWTVTDIYIDFDQRKADEANRLVAALAKDLGL